MHKLSICFLILLLAACKTAPQNAVSEEITYQPESQIITFTEADVQVTGITENGQTLASPGNCNLVIDLNANNYSGSTGCNRYFGKVEKVGEDQLVFYPGGMTEMACSAEVMEWESLFLKSLTAGAFTVDQRSGSLTLLSMNGEIVIRGTTKAQTESPKE